MEIITVHAGNIDKEHICCAISDKKGETCVSSKKAWMSKRFADGLVFRKLDARGKVFIEYMPAEKAWCPIVAPGYMHINCFWVSGQFKGQGWANQLLDLCIEDAKGKGMCGVTVLSSTKKMTFLSDPGYLKHRGFLVADKAPPSYELLYLPFQKDTLVPQFKDSVRAGQISEQGMVLFYSNQCPHTDKYAPILKTLANQRGFDVKLIKFETAEAAQNAPAPFTTYSFFLNGKFVTNEIFGEKKFEQFLNDLEIHSIRHP